MKKEEITIGVGRPTKYDYASLPFATKKADGKITGEYLTVNNSNEAISARAWGKRNGVKIVGKFDRASGKYLMFKLRIEEKQP